MQYAVLAWPRTLKRLVVVALDIAMAVVAMWMAFSLRLDTLHWPEDNQWLAYVLAPALAIPIFVRFGLYRAIFRYTGLATLIATGQAVALYGGTLLALLAIVQWQGMPGIPRSVGILQPLIFLLLVSLSRTLARFWLAGLSGHNRRAVSRLLIYGAGSAGAQTAAALASTRQYSVLGFIDDDPAKIGRSINDVRVFAPAQAARIVQQQGITDILLALPSATRERRNQIIEQLGRLPVHIRTVPGLSDLASGRVTVHEIHELDIEDLLGRPPVQPLPGLLARNLTGKVVLVTGAGGSIGSELCRQIVRERPRTLLLVDHSEFGLYTIHEELTGLVERLGMAVHIEPLLGSVTNHARMAGIARRHRPDTIYHAAAYKHVPMVEHNPCEGVENNVFGTLTMARVAIECGCAHFVLISTDKAVRPTNLMGASKRIAELILQALASAQQAPFTAEAPVPAGRPVFAMVRFGNVLGSSGSVVPLFRRQIAAGGPVTVTHPEVTRYFMTISEAVQLVLQAGAMAQGGDVFLLDMGAPVRIHELARRMILLSGHTVREPGHPTGDIEITISGMRPGEKLYEELLIGNNPEPTEHPRILRASEEHLAWSDLSAALARLHEASHGGDTVALRTLVAGLVPGSRLEWPGAMPDNAQALPGSVPSTPSKACA